MWRGRRVDWKFVLIASQLFFHYSSIQTVFLGVFGYNTKLIKRNWCVDCRYHIHHKLNNNLPNKYLYRYRKQIECLVFHIILKAIFYFYLKNSHTHTQTNPNQQIKPLAKISKLNRYTHNLYIYILITEFKT